MSTPISKVAATMHPSDDVEDDDEQSEQDSDKWSGEYQGTRKRRAGTWRGT